MDYIRKMFSGKGVWNKGGLNKIKTESFKTTYDIKTEMNKKDVSTDGQQTATVLTPNIDLLEAQLAHKLDKVELTQRIQELTNNNINLLNRALDLLKENTLLTQKLVEKNSQEIKFGAMLKTLIEEKEQFPISTPKAAVKTLIETPEAAVKTLIETKEAAATQIEKNPTTEAAGKSDIASIETPETAGKSDIASIETPETAVETQVEQTPTKEAAATQDASGGGALSPAVKKQAAKELGALSDASAPEEAQKTDTITAENSPAEKTNNEQVQK